MLNCWTTLKQPSISAISGKLGWNRRDMTGYGKIVDANLILPWVVFRESSLPEIHQIRLWTKMEITGKGCDVRSHQHNILGLKSQRGGMRAIRMVLPSGQTLTTPASLWLLQQSFPSSNQHCRQLGGQIGAMTPIKTSTFLGLRCIQKFQGNFIVSHEARPGVDP